MPAHTGMLIVSFSFIDISKGPIFALIQRRQSDLSLLAIKHLRARLVLGLLEQRRRFGESQRRLDDAFTRCLTSPNLA